MVDVKKFKFYLKKDSYYDIDDVRASVEKLMKHKIEKYFEENPNFHVIDIKTGWFNEEDEENYVFSVHVTYEVAPAVIDECLCL